MFKTRRKLLSQNFLRDSELTRRLIRASGISWNDTVLEIGPGTGTITRSLLSASKKVIAVETDQSLYTLLVDRLGINTGLKLIHGNFLDFELPEEPYKVFANIPFSITGEIVKKLLLGDNPPDSCDLIVQKEAAEKFMVNKRKNSMLSILFFPWFEMRIGHVFARTEFSPSPKVDLCLLHIVRRPVPLISHHGLNKYRDLVVFKFTKCRSASTWPTAKWLELGSITDRGHGYFAKWQKEQQDIDKIHRTRIDKNWKKYGK